MGRFTQITPYDNQPSGWAEITHPFHPLRGQNFQVLKSKKSCGADILSLRDSSGMLHAIPRDWTNLAKPSSFLDSSPAILHFDSLLALANLIKELSHENR